MNVQELREEKFNTEMEIINVLRPIFDNFQNKTGVSIRGMHLSFMNNDKYKNYTIGTVTLDLGI